MFLLRVGIPSIVLIFGYSLLFAHTGPELPEGLSASDWHAIQQQIQARQFEAQASKDPAGGWHAVNPSHGFGIEYRADGRTVLTVQNQDHAPHSIALQLQDYGYGDALIELADDPVLSADGRTVNYQWKPTLREWWVNSERGVEQWFELAERPAVDQNDQSLVVSMQLQTSLNAHILDNVLHLQSADGAIRITYNRLKVWDATGRILPARMELDGSRLALRVEDHDAIYPVTIDPTFEQTAYLKPFSINMGDQFGGSVAVSGDTVVIGSPFEDSSAAGVNGNQNDNSLLNSGAAYVFVRDGTDAWSQQAYLKASNPDTQDQFGRSVAISGDTIVIGAPEERSSATGVNGDEADNSAVSAGAAYVFVRDETDVWSQQAYLKASNTESRDIFGWSVAVSENTIVVGAIFEGSFATGVNGDQANNLSLVSGAAYVFVRDGTGAWDQQAYLKASNTGVGNQFGRAVAVSGNTVVIGAPFEGSNATGVNGNQFNNFARDAGAAYVFVRDGSGSWGQQAYLKASNTNADDRFGWSVAMSGETIAIGARGENSNATGINGDQADNSANDAGAAYVFVRNGTAWSQQAYLKASNAQILDEFGISVGVSGDIVVVGAMSESSNATGVNGDQADNSALRAGAAYTFVRDGSGIWSQQAYLKASNTDVDDRFGESVAVAGDTIIVGSPLEDSGVTGVNNSNQADNSADDAGTAYIFDIASTTFIVGGTVSSLSGSGLVLQNNAGDDLPITADGAFAFTTPLNDGATYSVTVASQPNGPSQTCNVTNGTGTVAGMDVTNVQVDCVTNTFTVGGSVSGLAGSGLVLQNNAGDDLTISANGVFTFPTPLNDGSAYNVTVASQPGMPNQFCSVTNGSGTLAGANVTNVQITCTTDTFTIGGSVSGLSGTGLVLQNNAGDDQPITANGVFTFATPLGDGAAYNVTVANQPNGLSQTCSVTNGTGTVVGANVTNVQINCVTDTFTVGGTVSGLAGAGLVLQNNGGDNLPIIANGPFTFPTAISDGSVYSVTVAGQPTGPNQICSVANGLGTLAGTNVVDVQVTCVNTFTIGGSVSGLAGTGLVLQNNAGDDLPITADGAFIFSTPIADGTIYSVTVTSQPTGLNQTCAVNNGARLVAGTNITNVQVECITDMFTIGGTVSGLAGSGLVLQNNASDVLSITADGAFTFTTPLDDGSAYAVTVRTQPTAPNQFCSVTNGSGTLSGTNVTDLQVICVDRFTIGGTVSGLVGTGLVLQNNAGDDLPISANGAFTFIIALDDGMAYNVTVANQPTDPSQTCSVTNGAGTVAGMNVTNVQIDCVADTFTVGGSVSGLSGSGLVLQNNGGDDLPITADGVFTFATPLEDGSAYKVTVAGQPAGPNQFCTVSNGVGAISGTNITNVQVTCVNTFTIGGNVSGLAGSGLVLQNNGGDDLPITVDGSFTFAGPLINGDAYAVSVLTQPTGVNQTCSINNGTSTVAGMNVTNVQVECVTDKITVGGSVSGLSGSGLVLQNNGSDNLPISANGPFTFPTAINDGSAYTVTVANQPTGPSQICSVTNGAGTLSGINVTDVQVTCVNSFTIGGTIVGLAGSGLVLQNNAGDDLSVAADGSFTFSTSLVTGATYAVTVAVQPTNVSQTCNINNGAGTVAGMNVTNIQVECTTDTFTIGGSVAGLSGSALVLQNNAGDDLPITADDVFTFATPLDDGSAFVVTVASQPTAPNQRCSVTNGSGTLAGVNVMDVQVTCVNSFTIGGNVAGLAGSDLVLQNNAGDDLPIAADGSFAFVDQLIDGATYTVTVAAQPTDLSQTCSVSNETGTVAGADITNVQIDCITDTFTVGGTVTGLSGTGLVLQNNAGDDLTISANGVFTFATSLEDGSAYIVTVASQPTVPNQLCSVSNGSDTLSGANVVDVQVTCINSFTIGGSVSGLAGTGLVLQNNAGDDLPIADDGTFTFTTPLGDGEAFAITVTAQPTELSQTCSVSNGTGTVAGMDVTDVQIECVTDTFTISGSVVGVSGSGLVLQNNGGDDLPITADGMFTFATALDDGSAYAVTVAVQPTGPDQLCTVNGAGIVSGADVTNIQVTCVNSFTVGGTVAGLSGSGLILQNNAGDDLPIAKDGSFTFAISIGDGTAFAVTITVQPTDLNQTCSITNGNGIIAGMDVTNVQIECITDAFTIGGSVAEFSGSGLVLQNNAGDDLPIIADGPFTFPSALADGSPFTVTVSSQPTEPSQTCTVSNATGVVDGANITTVQVQCILNGDGLLLPEQISFPNVQPGQISAIEPLVFGNIDIPDLFVGAVQLTGSDADQFLLVLDGCSGTQLMTDESCDLSVVFLPTRNGLKFAQLEVPSNEPDRPAVARLTGIGVGEDVLFSDSFE